MFARRVTHAVASSDLADRVRSILLPLVGIAAIVQAGFTVNPTVGWVAVGVGAWVVDWLTGDDLDPEGPEGPPSSMSTR